MATESQSFDPTSNNEVDWADHLSGILQGQLVATEDDQWYHCQPKTCLWQHLHNKDAVAVVFNTAARQYLKSLDLSAQDYEKIANRVCGLRFGQDLRVLSRQNLLDKTFPANHCPGWLPLRDGFKINLTTTEVEPILPRDHFLTSSQISSGDLTAIQAGLNQSEPKYQHDWLKVETFMHNLAFNRQGQVDHKLLEYHIKLSIYFLSGYNHWRIFYNLFTGLSGQPNGKSTYIAALVGVLGDMAQSVRIGDLYRPNQSHFVSTRLVYQDNLVKTTLKSHFVSEQLKAKLICATDYLSRPKHPGGTPKLRGECPQCTFVTEPMAVTEVKLEQDFKDWITGPGSAMFLYYLLTKSKELTQQGWDLAAEEGELPKSLVQ